MSYMDIMFEKWMNELPEEDLIKVYLVAGCNASRAQAILWERFVNSQKSIADNKGHWEMTTNGCTFFFEPFRNCDAITGAAFATIQRDIIWHVFTSRFYQESADWIADHVCTKPEGSNALVSMKDRAKAYRQSLDEFIDFKMDTDAPVLGKNYYCAVWVWED